MTKLRETLNRMGSIKKENFIKRILIGDKSVMKEAFNDLGNEDNAKVALQAYGKESWEAMNNAWALMNIGAAILASRKELSDKVSEEQKKLGVEVEREHVPEMKGYEGFRDFIASIIASVHLTEIS